MSGSQCGSFPHLKCLQKKPTQSCFHPVTRCQKKEDEDAAAVFPVQQTNRTDPVRAQRYLVPFPFPDPFPTDPSSPYSRFDSALPLTALHLLCLTLVVGVSTHSLMCSCLALLTCSCLTGVTPEQMIEYVFFLDALASLQGSQVSESVGR